MSDEIEVSSVMKGIIRLVRFDKSDIRGTVNGLRYTVKNSEYDKAINNLDINRIIFTGTPGNIEILDLPVEEDVVASIFSVTQDPLLPYHRLMEFTRAALSEHVELDDIYNYLNVNRKVFENLDPRYDDYVARFAQHYWPEIRLRVNRDSINMVFSNNGFTIF